MRAVNINAAKAQLSRLVEAAAAGEEIVITKRGKPVALLVPLDDPFAIFDEWSSEVDRRAYHDL